MIHDDVPQYIPLEEEIDFERDTDDDVEETTDDYEEIYNKLNEEIGTNYDYDEKSITNFKRYISGFKQQQDDIFNEIHLDSLLYEEKKVLLKEIVRDYIEHKKKPKNGTLEQ